MVEAKQFFGAGSLGQIGSELGEKQRESRQQAMDREKRMALPLAAPEEGSIASDLRLQLESPDGADVTLVVGSLELPAHSQILAARSRVFAAMLRSDMKESRTCRIVIEDMREAALRQLLCFIYTDTAPELGSVAEELLAAAEKYNLPLLKKRCEDKMAQGVNVENAADTALLAVMYRCQRLRASAVKFIAGHPEVLATKGWELMLRGNADAAVKICRLLAAELPHSIRTDVLPNQPAPVTAFGSLSSWK